MNGEAAGGPKGPRYMNGEAASGPKGPHYMMVRPQADLKSALHDGEHPVERDLGPVLAVLGDDDAISDLAFHQTFERPQQMVGRHTEHRRAEAAELIERQHRPAGM